MSGLARFHHRDFDAPTLAGAKGATTVSVCLPARNEEATVGAIVDKIRVHLMERASLVDEILVADDGSTDSTAGEAARAGAEVVTVRRGPGIRPGKGTAMAAGLGASSGDLVVFLDADVKNFGSHYVVGLLGPLLSDTQIGYVKATYLRPLPGGVGIGGRVTELSAKPLLERFHPELACFSQPLAGEIAARRRLIESLAFPCDYGVDVAILIDVARRLGLASPAEVDLGERIHRNRPLQELAPQARSVMDAILGRAALELAAGTDARAFGHETGYHVLTTVGTSR